MTAIEKFDTMADEFVTHVCKIYQGGKNVTNNSGYTSQ